MYINDLEGWVIIQYQYTFHNSPINERLLPIYWSSCYCPICRNKIHFTVPPYLKTHPHSTTHNSMVLYSSKTSTSVIVQNPSGVCRSISPSVRMQACSCIPPWSGEERWTNSLCDLHINKPCFNVMNIPSHLHNIFVCSSHPLRHKHGTFTHGTMLLIESQSLASNLCSNSRPSKLQFIITVVNLSLKQ